MKALKRLIIWILISLGMQIAVLYYVDNYLFASENVSGKIVATKIEDKKEKKKKNENIIIPEEAEYKNMSYDGGFLSYCNDDILKIVDTYTGKEDNIEFDQDKLKISFYKWAPDRNILIIAAKRRYNNSCKFLFYSYDAEKGVKEKLETTDQKETSFTGSRNSEVKDMVISPFTNMMYIKSGTQTGKSVIHNINIMQRINKVSTRTSFVGDMKIIPNDDRIVYEAVTRDKIYITGEKNSISIPEVAKLCLINVDDNDVIYLGEVEEGDNNNSPKVKNIYYGKNSEYSNSWKKISLPDNVKKEEIYVSRDGKIYINDNLKGIIKDLNSNKEVEYTGLFMQIYNGGIASISEGKLVETPIKLESE